MHTGIKGRQVHPLIRFLLRSRVDERADLHKAIHHLSGSCSGSGCHQVVNLQALPSEEADPALVLLCPVRALRRYVDRTRSFRSSEQLLVCYGGQQKGKAVSKQRLAHWIVDAITLAYQSQGEPCPLGVRAHSTWSVASTYALAHGTSLADICRAAGWVTPNTFARFYSLRIEPVSSRVLGNR